YLPVMRPTQFRRQVSHICVHGWSPAIEHARAEHTRTARWLLWNTPMHGETDVERILAAAEACHRANPNHHVRLTAYDGARQALGSAMVIYRAHSGRPRD